MRPSLTVILLFLFLLLCLAAAYFLSDSLQRAGKARRQATPAAETMTAPPLAKPAIDGTPPGDTTQPRGGL